MKIKSLIISALSGGGGKTLTSLALTRALKDLNYNPLPFKKGPDYIDAAWLAKAAQRKCYTLDPFFLDKNQLIEHFSSICSRADTENSIAIIEGNRGLYDGKDKHGSASTAELAYMLDAPILLTIDAKKATRTLAALVNGMVDFDNRINIIGLVINNIASKRHENIIRESIEQYCKIPIFGFIPRFEKNPIPERHLGLEFENMENEEILHNLSTMTQKNINMDLLLQEVEKHSNFNYETKVPEIKEKKSPNSIKIGYIMDKALWFYYSENLEMLENSLSSKNENVELIPLSLFEDSASWNELDALYIGGGYPELYAEEISKSPALANIKKYADANMPIYAECGGFMLLCSAITKAYTHEKHSMANIFPVELEFHTKPQGLGYVEAKVCGENPYFAQDTPIKGHEFHYSLATTPPKDTLFSLDTGTGMGNKKDALLYKNVFACYTHIYALTQPEWAKNFVELASKYREKMHG